MPVAMTTGTTLPHQIVSRRGRATCLHLHCLVLDGVYRHTEGEPVFQEAPAPTRDELQGLLDKIIARLMNMLTRACYLGKRT
jgi:hypothetical protein